MLILFLIGCGLVVLGILLYFWPSSARRQRAQDDKPYWLDKRGY
ncbi:MAG TPA: hypothetical protein PLK31_02635 [Chloroflexota bacterium]|nr:hypothetical protein [Chloroflexota bacterium]